MKGLKATKKQLKDLVDEARFSVKKAKEDEAAFRDVNGKHKNEVVPKVERVFKSYHIDKPYYHGGKYIGKAMNCFMTHSVKIITAVSRLILEIPAADRCPDSEVMLFSQRFSNVLRVFDLLFSTARIPSGLITDELVEVDLCNTVSEALCLWRGLDMSVNPKCHAFEDHLCDQMLCFGGIGDLGEDFIEQAHQDGIKDSKRTKNAKDWATAAQWHSNWEHTGERIH
jgi:hypothetical protein